MFVPAAISKLAVPLKEEVANRHEYLLNLCNLTKSNHKLKWIYLKYTNARLISRNQMDYSSTGSQRTAVVVAVAADLG